VSEQFYPISLEVWHFCEHSDQGYEPNVCRSASFLKLFAYKSM